MALLKSASNNTDLQLPDGKNTLLKFKELGSDRKGKKHEVEEAKSEAGLVHRKGKKKGKKNEVEEAKLQLPHANKGTGTPTGADVKVEGTEIKNGVFIGGTPTGGDVMVEGTEIKKGVFIGGVKARGPGHLSVLCTRFYAGSSAGDGISVVDVNINRGDVPDGGTLKCGKRTIEGGVRIGV